MVGKSALALGVLALLTAMTAPARADLRICNNTDSRVGVALGYKDKNGWATEGWWTILPKAEAPGKDGNCKSLLTGNLIARYYYVFAVDYTKGGSWGGKSMMCTQDKEFTIRGIENCESRGYTKTGFFEVDTSEEVDWTVSLSGDKTQGP